MVPTAFTRDGEFQVNSKGQLVTKEGYPVMGEAGPINLDLSQSRADVHFRHRRRQPGRGAEGQIENHRV